MGKGGEQHFELPFCLISAIAILKAIYNIANNEVKVMNSSQESGNLFFSNSYFKMYLTENMELRRDSKFISTEHGEEVDFKAKDGKIVI